MKADEKIIHIKDTFAVRTFSKEACNKLILCFPFVGGNSAHFRAFAECMPKGVQVMAVEPPGHGVAKGKLMREMDGLMELYYNNLLPYLNSEIYILGHSLGGLIGYLFSLIMEKDGKKAKRVFISASFPPDVVIEEREAYKDIINEKLIKETLNELGGNYKLLANTKSILMLSYMPIFHTDYKLFMSYKNEAHGVMKTPVSVIYSNNDDIVEERHALRWGKFCEDIEYFKVNGKHHYLLTEPQSLAEVVLKGL